MMQQLKYQLSMLPMSRSLFLCFVILNNRDTWSKPERVTGLDHVRVQAAFASGVVSAAVGDDGSLWAWGRSKRGQLGLGEGVIEAARPSKVEALAGHEIIKVLILSF